MEERTYIVESRMLIANSKGNYSFLRGIAPYSAGAIADTGYEIVRVRFSQPVPLAQGFELVKQHLSSVGRTVHALCGMELRSPQPFSFQGFNQFNSGYVQVLKSWGVIGEVNPVARTNVAPETVAPSVPSVYGFSYTMPSKTKRKTFVVAGAGELPEGSLDPHDVVRRGETSGAALLEKTQFVVGLMAARLQGLGVSWQLATAVDVYTVHPICDMMAGSIVKPIGASAVHGVTWHFARPPIDSIEFEMDVRGCERELVLG